jgi:hypothetical protein
MNFSNDISSAHWHSNVYSPGHKKELMKKACTKETLYILNVHKNGNTPQEKVHNHLQVPPWNASFQKKITKRVHGLDSCLSTFHGLPKDI